MERDSESIESFQRFSNPTITEYSKFGIVKNKLIAREDDALLRHVIISQDGANFEFLVRIINKAARKRRYNYISGVQSTCIVDGIEKLYGIIEARQQIRNPNVLSLFAVRDTQPFVILFEEWCDGGPCMREDDNMTYHIPAPDQKNCIQREDGTYVYSEEEAARIFWGICNGLSYLHNRQLCHMNIRPDYFIFNRGGSVKLSGFAQLSNVKSDLFGGLRQHFPGDSLFQAPECWKEGLFSSYSADLWSLGVCLYYMVFGRSPIEFTNIITLVTNLRNYAALPPLEGISPELAQLLTAMLNPDVALRPSLKEILSSSWLQRFGYHFQEESSELSPIKSTTEGSFVWTSAEFVYMCDAFDFVTSLFYEKDTMLKTSTSRSSLQDLSFQKAASLQGPPRNTIEVLTRSNSAVTLPHRGKVQYKSSSMCWLCYKKCELYVEKGRAFISFANKSVMEAIALGSAYLVDHHENPYVFELRTENGDMYLFKTYTQEDKLTWEVAISYAIRLGKQ